MSNEGDESKLLAACQAGKSKEQEKLYQKYYGKMMSICLRYAKDQDEAKDILQEGFVKVFSNIKTFKGEGSLEGWIKRIMVNTAINHYHKNKKYVISNTETEIPDVGEQPDFDEEAIKQLSYEDILELIRSLTPAYQTVFSLYVIEGYSHKEIANLLQINEGTSKSNLAKARIKLQKMLKDRKNYVGTL
jgi:RNA polymerase sigma-70 factor (ECF subfamily)